MSLMLIIIHRARRFLRESIGSAGAKAPYRECRAPLGAPPAAAPAAATVNLRLEHLAALSADIPSPRPVPVRSSQAASPIKSQRQVRTPGGSRGMLPLTVRPPVPADESIGVGVAGLSLPTSTVPPLLFNSEYDAHVLLQVSMRTTPARDSPRECGSAGPML
jgi:hypothetical protein